MYYKIKGLLQGRLTIYIDNFTNYKDIYRDYIKVTEGVLDRAISIVEIKRLLKKIKIVIRIEHRTIKKKKVVKFEDDPPLFLL